MVYSTKVIMKIKLYLLCKKYNLRVYIEQLNSNLIQIMEINQKLKQSQNLLSEYSISLTMPFMVNAPIFRKSHRYERDGHWNEKQKLKYSVFISYFHKLLEDPQKKRKIKIYDMMSDMIITRNSNQCRSHHQKMEKYRKNIPNIINAVAEKYQPALYRQLQQKYQVLLKGVLDNAEKYKRRGQVVPREKTDFTQVKMQESEDLVDDEKNNQQRLQFDHYNNLSPQQKIDIHKMEAVSEQKNMKPLVKTDDRYDQIQSQDHSAQMRLNSQEEADDDEEQEQQGERQQYKKIGKQIEGYHHELKVQQNDAEYRRQQAKERNDSQNPKMPNEQEPPMMDYNSIYMQVTTLQLKKQWHLQNADQLWTQWTNEIQNAKDCEENINHFNNLLSEISRK